MPEMRKMAHCEQLVSYFNRKKYLKEFVINLLKAYLRAKRKKSLKPIEEEIEGWEATAELIAGKSRLKLWWEFWRIKRDLKKGRFLTHEEAFGHPLEND